MLYGILSQNQYAFCTNEGLSLNYHIKRERLLIKLRTTKLPAEKIHLYS